MAIFILIPPSFPQTLKGNSQEKNSAEEVTSLKPHHSTYTTICLYDKISVVAFHWENDGLNV